MGDTKGIPPNQMASNANGTTKLLVAELHWWTTDSDIESVLIQYGEVKEIYFFCAVESGQCKGHCQVEFYDPAAASACKAGMNGHIFYGRPCVVEFYSLQTLTQLNASYHKRIQAQAQAQARLRRRNPVNGGNGANYPSRDTGRNQAPYRGPGSRPLKVMGNAPGAVGGTYGQGIAGLGFGMMDPGFDLAFMGHGAGYGGFPGMHPPFQAVYSMGLRGMGGWGREEHGRQDNASEYGHGVLLSHERDVRPSAASLEWERNYDGERYDRDYRHRDRESGREKGQSPRSHRSRSSAVPEDGSRARSRDADDKAPSE